MQTIETRRLRDQERFEENRRFEEMTDIAERLGYPIDTTIHYELRGDAVYASSDTVDRPFHNQTLQAMLAGERHFGGDQSFQRERLRLEHEEALTVDQFAAGKLLGNVLIKFSKIPDAVVENRTNINGYRRDLLRSFVRLYYKTDVGVSCRLFTLDHNDQLGMKRVGELLGIDTLRPSEAILADHRLVETPGDPEYFVDQLVARTVTLYDRAIAEQTGSTTHAGSHYLSQTDAMSAIYSQSHLVTQHMDAITAIMQMRLGEDVLEQERKKTAAAIKLASEGYAIASNSDSAVAGEVTSGNYDRECATTNGMNQAQTMENKWTQGECQVCFAKTMVGSCMVCASCAAADDRGVDLLKLRDHNLRRQKVERKMASTSVKYATTEKRSVSKQSMIRQQYGDNAVMRRELVIGGAHNYIVDKTTGTVLAEV